MKPFDLDSFLLGFMAGLLLLWLSILAIARHITRKHDRRWH